MEPRAYRAIIFFVFFVLFRMTPSTEITRTTHLSQFGGVYFGLQNHYKSVLNIVKNFFFLLFMMPIKTYTKFETIVLYFVIKKLEISFQNGPEHETTSLMEANLPRRIFWSEEL